MSNRLSMAQTQAIQALAATGNSHRAIAKALGIDRSTVAKTLSQIQNQPPVWEALTGSGDAAAGIQDADQVSESGLPQATESDPETCPAGITTGSSSSADGAETMESSRSECEAYRDEILRKLEQGLTAQRIWQDLVDERGFSAKYHSVRRYVSKLQIKTPQLVRRMEVAAGEEAQIDFGTGAWITTTDAVTGKSKRRRTWVFRIVLSHSSRIMA